MTSPSHIICSLRYCRLCAFLVSFCCIITYWYLHQSNLKHVSHSDSNYENSMHIRHQIKSPNGFIQNVLDTIHPKINVSKEIVKHSHIDHSPLVLKNQTSVSVLASKKLVLLWTPFFDSWSYIPQGQSGFLNCPISDCFVTIDRRKLPESDALLFHIRDLVLTDLPRIRLPHQYWIFYCLESPIYSYFSGFRFMQGIFNWTMTYRSDSDIVIKYGYYKEDRSDNNSFHLYEDLYNLWQKKKGMVVWMVSHCSTYSKREIFVQELQKYIDVSVYGLCGVATCPLNMTKECLKRFEEKFMFILALENAICKDYVTEKFFDALRYNMIPIVLGGADYRHIAPPNSFIDALKFSSPKELVKYLYTVARDFEMYYSYLAWKKDYHIFRFDDGLCELCSKLHVTPLKEKKYGDLKQWWVDASNCHSWRNPHR